LPGKYNRLTHIETMRKLALIVPLLVMMAFAIWYASLSWTALEGPDMPAGLYVAMGLGIFFSILIGCGLMALVFYSSRRGYDDPHGEDKDRS
jgi:hypothetical protein